MSLDAFVYDLHFDTDKAKPLEWEADWENAPHAYKLYRRLPVFPLSPEVPLTLEQRSTPVKPNLLEIGHFLWYVFGLSQVCQSVLPPADFQDDMAQPLQQFRRFVPSGGGLYPSELYIYLKLDDLPSAVYHYDPAHHRLVMLRQGGYDAYLARALGESCDVSSCFGIVFVSTMFWKNFFKYYNFSYRLQGLDAGVLIGQLLEAANRYGFGSAVCYQFLDRAVNHLLGLSEQEESVYAIIPLCEVPTAAWFTGGKRECGTVSAIDLCGELPALRHDHFIRSRTIAEYPMLVKMNEASMFESVRSFRQLDNTENAGSQQSAIALPHVERVPHDLAFASRVRNSPAHEFYLSQVSKMQLAAMLQAAAASFPYRNDLDGPRNELLSCVCLYVCIYNSPDIPDGAYRYDAAAHSLCRIRAGDCRPLLQGAMSLGNVNLFQVPLCVHVAGHKNHLSPALGYRGYRIQQMEAGVLVQRLLLAAAALGMGARPLLGFEAKLCDDIYNLAALAKTCLIQIPVGPYRHRSRLEGSLHS